MKRLIVLCVALIVILIPAFLFAASCDSEGADYYITFTMGGVEYNLSFGYSDVDTGEPFVAVQLGEPDWIYFAGRSVDSTEAETPTGDYICVESFLYPYTQGVYTGTYTLGIDGVPDSYIGDGYLYIDVVEEGEPYFYYSTSGTVTITSFGEVGEAVEGNFNVHISIPLDFIIGSFAGPLLEIEYNIEGTFRLKRVEYILLID